MASGSSCREGCTLCWMSRKSSHPSRHTFNGGSQKSVCIHCKKVLTRFLGLCNILWLFLPSHQNGRDSTYFYSKYIHLWFNNLLEIFVLSNSWKIMFFSIHKKRNFILVNEGDWSISVEATGCSIGLSPSFLASVLALGPTLGPRPSSSSLSESSPESSIRHPCAAC